MTKAYTPIYVTTVANVDEGGDTIPCLYFDAVTSFAPTYRQKTTDYKMTTGTNLNFHTYKAPIEVTMEAWISTIPILEYSSNMIGYSSLSDRPKSAADLLVGWFTNNTLLYVEGELASYTNMVLTEVLPQMTGTDSVKFRLVFKKQTYATYQKTTVSQYLSDDAAKDSGTNTSSSVETTTNSTYDSKLVSTATNTVTTVTGVTTYNQAAKELQEGDSTE